jgi:epoxyqueuosine reductase
MPRYTRRDEYAALRESLRRLGERLRNLAPRSRFAVYVDSNHHVDREAAARAGIAVYGKNTLAITRRHGSWVVLGVLVTDAELAPTHAEPGRPAWEVCGSCRACIDACPTGAIVADGVLDARRCLSWLSQSRLDELPHAAAFGDRVYGCDICQDVCPWNTGADRRAAELEPDGVDDAYPPLREWLEADPDALAERYRRLYVPDRDGRHLQRNARVALANVTGDASG